MMEGIKQNEIPEAVLGKVVLTEQPASAWYDNISYVDVKGFLRTNMMNVSRSFIAIGFYLRYAEEHRLYLEEYNSIWEFAEYECGISRTYAGRLMKINKKFSKDGNSPVLDAPYQEFNKGQLQEMLYLMDEQLEQVTPDMSVSQIRGMRQRELKEIPYFEIPGQMDIGDYILDEYPEDDIPVQDQSYVLDITDLAEHAGEQEEACAISHTEEPGNVGTEDEEELTETVLDEDEDEVELCQPIEYDRSTLAKMIADAKAALDTMQDYWIQNQPYTYAKYAMQLQAYELLMEQHDRESVVEEPEQKEQPELPVLRNNDRRKEWLDTFHDWPVWFEVPEAGETYYRYDLPDGSSLVICGYHHWLEWKEKWSDENPDSVGTREYLLKPGYHYLADCRSSRTAMIEKLKEVQKKG